jgi:hypothetical protein
MNNYIDSYVEKLINDIINKINNYNVDIDELCSKLYLSVNDFLDIINHPRKNVSLYLEILDILDGIEVL